MKQISVESISITAAVWAEMDEFFRRALKPGERWSSEKFLKEESGRLHVRRRGSKGTLAVYMLSPQDWRYLSPGFSAAH